MLLKNKSVLITGASSGIGLATARMMIAQGTRVAIVPGATYTPVWTRGARASVPKAETMHAIDRSIPIGRIAQTEAIAHAVLFLASKPEAGRTG